MRKSIAAMMVASLLMVAVLATSADGRPGTRRVEVRDNYFKPHGVRIFKRSRVRWIWKGDNRHNVRCVEGCGRTRIGSSTKTGGTFTVKFNRRGDFTFECTIHGGNMYTNVHVR
jgi:plastocyanin